MKRKAVISLLLALFMALCPILLPAGGARQAQKARVFLDGEEYEAQEDGPCPDPADMRSGPSSAAEMRTIKSNLEISYGKTVGNSTISENTGYLIALKAIQFAIDGKTYSQMDCSKMTYEACKAAYNAKGLLGYYIFGTSKINSAAQYSVCTKNNLLSTQSARRAGDLIFWTSNSTGKIGHVGIYLGYFNGKHMIVDSSSSYGRVVVREMWPGGPNSTHKYKDYARINKPFTVTFRLGQIPFNNALFDTQKVLHNCPAKAPAKNLPTHVDYVFRYWYPTLGGRITSNTTYTAIYRNETIAVAGDTQEE